MNFTALLRYKSLQELSMAIKPKPFQGTIQPLRTFSKYNIQYFRQKVKTIDYYLIHFGYVLQNADTVFVQYNDNFVPKFQNITIP